MKQGFFPLLTILVLAAGSGVVAAAEAGAREADVAAQDLVKVRESARVGAALWTRRTDSYTLQLVYGGVGIGFTGSTIASLRGLEPSFGTRAQAAAQPVGTRIAPRPAKTPEFQVWLLRSNGTQILPTYRSPTPDPAKCNLRCIAQEVLYRFSLADGDEAVAAVVRVDGEYYVEKLQPLKPAP